MPGTRQIIERHLLPPRIGLVAYLQYDGTREGARRVLHGVTNATRCNELRHWDIQRTVNDSGIRVTIIRYSHAAAATNRAARSFTSWIALPPRDPQADAARRRSSSASSRPHARRWGVEIEVTGIGTAAAAAALTRAGVRARAESYNHVTRRHWKCTTDATVSGGCEVVSPPLSGDEGYRQLQLVCRALTEAGASINSSCGLHVHVEAGQMNREQIAAWVRLYAARQNAFDQLVAQSRRDNQWCRRWNTRLLESVLRRFVENGLMAAMSRYMSVNVNSYARRGTIEFRQHGGSVEYDKISRWVELLLATAEAAVAGTDVDAELWGMLRDLPLTEVTRRWFYYRAAVLA